MTTKQLLLLPFLCAATIFAQGPQGGQQPLTPPPAEKPKPTPRPDGQTASRDERLVPVPADQAARIAAALPEKAAARPKSPRKVLIFNRTEGFVHSSIPVGDLALRRLGEKTGAYSVVVSDDMAMFEPETLMKFDAVIFNNTTRLKFENPVHRKALLDFVAAGKGVAGVHAASDNFDEWPEGQALIGGLFHGHPWVSSDVVAIKLDEPKHVLNEAFQGRGFWLQEEIYQMAPEPYSRQRQRVLMSLDMGRPENQRPPEKIKRTDNDFAISWIRTEGPGRVFYTSLGHREDVFFVPEVLKHMLDGIQFALGDLEADAIPSAKLPVPPQPALAPDDKTTLQQKSAAAFQKSQPAPNSTAAASAPPSINSIETAIQAITAYRWGDNVEAFNSARNFLRTLPQAQRTAAEPALLALLEKADTSRDQRSVIYPLLPLVATDAAVPILAKLALLPDDADPAVRALAEIGSPAARTALLSLAANVDNPRPEQAVNGLRLLPGAETASGLAPLVTFPLTPAGRSALQGLAASGQAGLTVLEKLHAEAPGDAEVTLALLEACSRVLSAKSTPASTLARLLPFVQVALAETNPLPVRTASATLLVSAYPKQAATLAPLMTGADPLLARIAVQGLLRSGNATDRQLVVDAFPKLDPQATLFAVSAAGGAGNRAIVDLGLASKEPRIRNAAIDALADMEDKTSASELIKLVLTDPGVSTNAAAALARLKRGDADNLVLAAINDPAAPAEARVQLLKVAANRQVRDAFPIMVNLAQGSDEALKRAALDNLVPLVQPGDLNTILALAGTGTAKSGLRAGWRRALFAAASAHQNPAEAAAKLSAAMASPTAAGRAEIIGALSLVNDPAATQILAAQLDNPSPETRKDAIRALSAARTSGSALLLLQVMRTESKPEDERILATRGSIDYWGAFNGPLPARLNGYREIITAAPREQEKAAVLAAVRQIKHPSAEKFLREFEPPSPPQNTPPSPAAAAQTPVPKV